jgi:WD40 repeat protein
VQRVLAYTPSPHPALPGNILTTLRGHTEIVSSVAFSPDGKQILTGSFDRTLKLWESATGKEIKTFDGPAGHHDLVLSVAFSPDSRILASGSADKTAKLWDTGKVAAKAAVKNLAHANLVDAVAFNPAGTQLATGSHDGTVRIWDVAKGQQVRQITAHTLPMMTQVYCVAWSPDGKQLVSGSLDHSLRLWDTASGTLIREFRGYKQNPPPAALGASTAGLLSSLRGQGPSLAAAALIRARMDEGTEKGHREGVFTAAFSPDGKLLASGGSDRSIKLWNVANGTVVRELLNPNVKAAAHPGWVYSLRFTPTGSRLVSAGSAPRNQGYLAVWDVAGGKLLYGQELPVGAIYSVAVSPDGERLALACGPRSPVVARSGDRATAGVARSGDHATAGEANGYVLKMPQLSLSKRLQSVAPSEKLDPSPD